MKQIIFQNSVFVCEHKACRQLRVTTAPVRFHSTSVVSSVLVTSRQYAMELYCEPTWFQGHLVFSVKCRQEQSCTINDSNSRNMHRTLYSCSCRYVAATPLQFSLRTTSRTTSSMTTAVDHSSTTSSTSRQYSTAILRRRRFSLSCASQHTAASV